MISKVEKRIQELECGLPDRIRQVQMSHIPSVIEMTLMEKSNYHYKGEIRTADNGKRIFLVHNLPIKSAVNKQLVFNKTLETAVDENLIHPFILFINNKAIKWSDIEVIVDYKYNYLLINTTESIKGNIYNGTFHSGFINIDTGNIETNEANPNSIYSDLILLKKGVSYTITGFETIYDWRIRKWDINGNYIESDFIAPGDILYTPSSDILVRVMFHMGLDDYSNFQIIGPGGKVAEKVIKIPYRVRYGEDNIVNINYQSNFYFDSQGLLTSNTSAIVMRVEIISSYLNYSSSDYSNGYIEVASDNYDKPATINNIIIFKDGVLVDESTNLVDKGYNIFTHIGDTTGMIFKTFYYNKGNSSIDNIYKLNSDTIKNNIINNISTTYMTKLKENLNLDISNDISDNKNIESLLPSEMHNLFSIPLNDNKFLVSYNDSHDSFKQKLFVTQYDDNHILTIGTQYVICTPVTSNNQCFKMIKISEYKVLIVYVDSTNNYGRVKVVTISNLDLIISGEFSFESTIPIFSLSAAMLTSTKFIVAYGNTDANKYGYTQMIDFSNDYSSMDVSNTYAFTTNFIYNIKVIGIDENTACILYSDSLGYGSANVVYIDSQGINIGDKYIFNPSNTSNINTLKLSDGKFLVIYIDDILKNAVAQILNIDGNSISALPKYVFSNSDVLSLKMSAIDKNNIFIILYNINNIISYGSLYTNESVISYNYNSFINYNNIAEYDIVGAYNKLYLIFTDSNNSYHSYIDHIYTSYNEMNIKLKKIMNYNPQLLESIYTDLIPFNTVTYTGAEILSKKDAEGYITMLRRRYNNIFSYVIIFKNGELFENYYTITYINNTFKVLIGDSIIDTDSLEFVFIKNIDNFVGDIVIPSKDTSMQLSSKFNPDNFNLFSTEAESRTYQLTEGTTVNYNIPFTSVDNGDNNYNLKLSNSFYYGKSIKVVSDRLFKYKKIVAQYNQVDIALGDDFKYCINKNKYMVFLNGRLLNSNNFVLAIPGYNNPFDQPLLYINVIILPNDEVEVFYLPFELTDAYSTDTISSDGDISINDSFIPFSLGKDAYWYFINGRKINSDNINNISDTRININTDYESTNNFTLMKFISPLDVISRLISNEDNWNNIISSLGTDIKNFYQYTTLTNIETNIKINETDMKATILEAFRHYYSKYNTGDSLLYDFNDILIDGNDKDSIGNFIVHSSDASQVNSVDVDR